MKQRLIIKELGLCDYQTAWQEMMAFTADRQPDTPDEIWLLEHPPVFTQGLAGKPEHVLHLGDIPLVHTDRGGQVTYHGPGQLVAYVLFDLRRLNIGIRRFVTTLETSVVELLAEYGIESRSRCDAHGVYVNEAKICSIGLRVKRACSYHGIALNVNMDLEPFTRINPCGFSNMTMTQISEFLPSINMAEVGSKITDHMARNFWGI
jgi:lipoyl(octanoyl) transferase